MSELNRRTATLLKELRLSSIKEFFKEVTERAEKEELGYGEYLLELLEIEASQRNHKRVGRYLHESKLPLEKCVKTFDMKRLPFKTRRVVEVLLEGDFLTRKENVLAFGNPGSGKTHLLCAIAQELIQKGHRIYFTSCSRFVEELLKAKATRGLEKALKKMDKFDAVLIDDIGYVQYSREEMEVLFTFLAQRYERGSVMLTSNLAFSKWEQIFKDPMTTAAVIDRLVHHSVILELNLESYRMEVAKQQKREDCEE